MTTHHENGTSETVAKVMYGATDDGNILHVGPKAIEPTVWSAKQVSRGKVSKGSHILD